MGLKTTAIAGGVLVVGAASALTNPSIEAYATYGAEQLSAYANAEVCAEAPSVLGSDVLRAQCQQAIASLQPQIQQLLIDRTEHQNFGVFSLYRTQINLQDLLPPELGALLATQINIPVYESATAGVFNQFYTYHLGTGAEENGEGGDRQP
jgi:hypothetical protein